MLKALALTLLMSFAISSCELLDCKTCDKVTTTSGVETGRLPGGVPSCGDDLAEKENYSQTIGYTYIYYDCN